MEKKAEDYVVMRRGRRAWHSVGLIDGRMRWRSRRGSTRLGRWKMARLAEGRHRSGVGFTIWCQLKTDRLFEQLTPYRERAQPSYVDR